MLNDDFEFSSSSLNYRKIRVAPVCGVTSVVTFSKHDYAK